VIIADSQTAGRGRLGRAWHSPAGKNIYMSTILRPTISQREIPILTLMASVAIAAALRNITGLTVLIKWPNDLIVCDRKAGGILTETKTHLSKIAYVVIGAGINVNFANSEMPNEIRETATSLLQETGSFIPRWHVVAEVMRQFNIWYTILLGSGKARILQEWSRLSSTPGKAVRVTAGGEVVQGVAEGIDNNGFLILRLPDDSLSRISAGDLEYI
jgi:BirA family biotin operon repressor/biotin-[acetyl-CoA-carboxylase] ligase